MKLYLVTYKKQAYDFSKFVVAKNLREAKKQATKDARIATCGLYRGGELGSPVKLGLRSN
jgi:hypothetical protein